MSMISIVLFQVQPVLAIDTVISTPPLVDGDFLITAYSFSGHSLRYVQIFNDSSSVVSLDGWKLQTEWLGGMWQVTELNGLVAPNNKVTIADEAVVPAATFTYAVSGVLEDPRLDTIRLMPPAGSGLLDSVVQVGIKDSGSSMTPRDTSTLPETFYFERNRSTSTGNYLSTFSASSDAPSELESDPLYSPAPSSPLQVVELYPRAVSCSPATDGPLCYDYVKLFNASLEPVDLSKFRLRSGAVNQSATSSNTAYPTGVIPSGSYVSIAHALTDSGSFVWLEDTYGLVVYADSSIEYPSASARQGYAWSYNVATGKWQWTQNPTPQNEPNRFGVDGVVNTCNGLRLSEIAANYDPQFIEVYNSTTKAIDMSGCQLQTNRSETARYVFASDSTLGAGAYLAVPIAQTDLTMTKTTTGTVYILSSDGSVEVDARSYENLDADTSLALVGGTWQQTFTVTPGSENTYQQYPPCEAGYTRNDLTGRCNKNPTPTVLAPCGPGEYRNPETNRCKKIASTESELKPCAEGYERNPETNRCRKVLGASTSIPSAEFPVEPIADTAKAFTAWWALGGVLLLGLGYAGWEWRYEIRQFIRRITTRSVT